MSSKRNYSNRNRKEPAQTRREIDTVPSEVKNFESGGCNGAGKEEDIC